MILNNAFKKHINGKKNCFLSDIKGTKSPNVQRDNLKIWTMKLTLLPNQILIMPEYLFTRRMDRDIENYLELVDDEQLR